MAYRLDSDVRGYGQADVPATTAVTSAAAPLGTSLLPYYLVAVAAGVTVWFVTKLLSKKR